MARRRSRKAAVTLGRAVPEAPTTTTLPPPPTVAPRESAYPRLLKPQELADRLGVAPITIRRMLEARELPYVPVGKRVRFVYDEVVAHLRKPK